MQVNFNYQINGTTGDLQTGKSFPVLELVEHRRGGLDFAMLRLGRNGAGRFPGEILGMLTVAGNDLFEDDAMLCLIQHPNGVPKQVEAGPMKENIAGRISYASLDTVNGSSGARERSVNRILRSRYPDGRPSHGLLYKRRMYPL